MKHLKQTKIIKCTLLGIVGIVCLYFIYNFVVKLIPHMAIELAASYNWDTPVYWAMGRGILNGLTPYVDMFEIKGPGIFYITALSFLTSNGPWVGNLINFICLLFIGFSPLGALLLTAKKIGIKSVNFITYPIAIIFGGIIMMYSSFYAGQIQTESFGAGFACIYLMIISTIDVNKIKWNSISIWLAAIFMMLSVGMKEPFILLCFAGALIFATGLKHLFKVFILPLLYAIALGALIMLVTGMLIPYFKNYLFYIFTNHVTRSGSIFEKLFAFEKFRLNLNSYSDQLLPIVIVSLVFSFLIVVFTIFQKNRSIWYKIFNIIKFVPTILLPFLAVGLGGEYYGHHFIFAIPVYIALIIYMLINLGTNNTTAQSENKIIKSIAFAKHYILAIILLFSFSVVLDIKPFSMNSPLATCMREAPVINADANKVDALLDKMNVDRYMYIGMNGPVFMGLTKHSPQGPIFLHDIRFFVSEYVKNNAMDEIKNSKILVVEDDLLKTGWKMYSPLREYMENNYTKNPPAIAKGLEMPSPMKYTVFFHK
ncbi:MAG: hypothetical protein WCQ41_06595 [Bacillota bacterium]